MALKLEVSIIQQHETRREENMDHFNETGQAGHKIESEAERSLDQTSSRP